MKILHIPLANIRRAVGRNVLLLGMVSLFTDLSSEMIYPLLPVFFTGLLPLGAAVIYIGLMDGIAESTSSLLKIFSGRWSDRANKRKPLAVMGYGISTLARPLLALAMAGWQVIALRFTDRIGKGLRTSPRDALISESADADVRGLAYSFHRMMDHTGAVCGPLLAMLFLYLMLGKGILWHHETGAASPPEMSALRWLFALALLPGLLAMTMWLGVREKRHDIVADSARKPAAVTDGQHHLSGRFYVFITAIVLFTLGNSSDLFLVFYARVKFGLGLGWMIALWVILHLAKIVFSLPGGGLSDRIGRRRAIISGWLIYLLVYLGMPFAGNLWWMIALLIVYGAYYGMTEGAERALVADFVPANTRGKAFGLYHGAMGFAALPASLIFGVFWAAIGPTIAFFTGAGFAAAAIIVFTCSLPEKKQTA